MDFKTNLFIVGFPSLYGGAGAELYHQLKVWREMGLDLHIIPTQRHVQTASLYGEVVRMGVKVHAPWDWSAIPEGVPVISFCNEEFLRALPEIRLRTRRTIFVNCMTWLFEQEKEALRHGDIGMFLYQNDAVRQKAEVKLRALMPETTAQFLTFYPYFDASAFPFIGKRPSDHFCAGHISRQDADKFSKDTCRIYEGFASPVEKRGCFLGYDARSEKKTGPLPDWIDTYRDQRELSQQEFYRRCHVILQPTDTTENWPRIGFEAMASGSVLIVDRRGGWEQMVEHGKTGWLCSSPAEFIDCASRMAWEPHRREDMAAAARERGLALGGLDASAESWSKVLQAVEQIPDAPTRPPCIASADCRLLLRAPGAPAGEREEPTRLLIGICSCAKARERRDAIRATWLKKLPAYTKACFFIGGGSVPPGEEGDTIALNVPDTYAELPQKIFAFFRHALASDREFGWLFKCDDDTYLAPHRLCELMDVHYDLVGDVSVTKRKAPSGGAGYLLTRAFVEKLVAEPSIPATGAEDLIVGERADKLGARMQATGRLFLDNTRFPVPWNRQVSAHWCTPDQMRAMHLVWLV